MFLPLLFAYKKPLASAIKQNEPFSGFVFRLPVSPYISKI